MIREVTMLYRRVGGGSVHCAALHTELSSSAIVLNLKAIGWCQHRPAAK